MTINSDHLDQLGEAMKRFADSGWANLVFDDTVTAANSNRVEQDDRFYLLALAVQAVATELRELRLALTAATPVPDLELSAGQVWALIMLNEVTGRTRQPAILSRVGGRFQMTIAGTPNTVVSHSEFEIMAEAGLIRSADGGTWFTTDAGRYALVRHGVTP